jgi:hypothetical protein
MRYGTRAEFLACVRAICLCVCSHVCAYTRAKCGERGMDSSISNALGAMFSFFDRLGDSERERVRIRMPS